MQKNAVLALKYVGAMARLARRGGANVTGIEQGASEGLKALKLFQEQTRTLNNVLRQDIIEFPILVSSSVNPETAAMIRRGTEANMALLVKMWLDNFVTAEAAAGGNPSELTQIARNALGRESLIREAGFIPDYEDDNSVRLTAATMNSVFPGMGRIREAYPEITDIELIEATDGMATMVADAELFSDTGLMRSLSGDFAPNHSALVGIVNSYIEETFRNKPRRFEMVPVQDASDPTTISDLNKFKAENLMTPTPVTLTLGSADARNLVNIIFLVKAVIIPVTESDLQTIPKGIATEDNGLTRTLKLFTKSMGLFEYITGASKIRQEYVKDSNLGSNFAEKMLGFKRKLSDQKYMNLGQVAPVFLKTTMVFSLTDSFQQLDQPVMSRISLRDHKFLKDLLDKFGLMQIILVDEPGTKFYIYENDQYFRETVRTFGEYKSMLTKASNPELYKLPISTNR